eukprot:993423-Rhodomonas_salina.1
MSGQRAPQDVRGFFGWSMYATDGWWMHGTCSMMVLGSWSGSWSLGRMSDGVGTDLEKDVGAIPPQAPLIKRSAAPSTFPSAEYSTSINTTI